ncbi:MAG: hypothetical protein P8Y24_12855 [Gammaproteobacteria bacterium]
MRKSITLMVSGLLVLLMQSAHAEAPNFMAAIYADGNVYGTKGTTNLPAPNANNEQSFDNLYVITNFNDPNAVQLPVSEAAPGNPKYNGGRWSLQFVTWTADGFMAYGGYAPVIKSAEELEYNKDLGYLTVSSGSTYFQCPLLPVK